MSMPACLLNGEPADRIPVTDRGLGYGDGLFRTVLLKQGRPTLWHWHWQCLLHDCAALGLPLPAESVLLAELAQLAAALPLAVGKIVLTRGSGARGYAMPQPMVPTRLVSVAGFAPQPCPDGVTVRGGRLERASQPRLAGVKHLNRLENVLARAEWDDPAIREGLLCDAEGWLTEACACNVFVDFGSHVATPLLDRCGVAGAARACLLDRLADCLGRPVRVERIARAAVGEAQGLWLCNSVVGVLPVRRLDALAFGLPDSARVAADILAAA